MLTLDQQNQYRDRYKVLRPGWRTSGDLYEALVRRYLPPEPSAAWKVLDLGCGAGGVMERWSAHVPLSVGVDPDLASLRANRDPCIRLASAQVEHLPFSTETFNLVVSSWVLEHLPAPQVAFAEIGRVLKRGGHFVFLTPNARHPLILVNHLVPRASQARLVRHLYGRAERNTFRVRYRANTFEQIQALATTAGLRLVSFQTVPDPTYLAFTPALFRLNLFIERFISSSRAIHIIGDYVKP